MGEYIIYYKGRIAGGICDNRFLVKPVKAAVALLPDAPLEKPYDGAKEMLVIENTEDREFLAKLFNTMYDELPVPKKKSKKK
jgi:TfoX/Sxy family transcriptional regulator of competence genes